MQIQVSCDGDGDSIKVTDIHCDGYQKLEECVREVFGEIPVIPTMLNGGTDSKHFKTMTDNIVRFTPIYISPEQGSGVHGLNERLYTDQMKQAVQYYQKLLEKYAE
jgi:carboxypeptidase PM20D1